MSEFTQSIIIAEDVVPRDVFISQQKKFKEEIERLSNKLGSLEDKYKTKKRELN